jgi:hypothetical protein
VAVENTGCTVSSDARPFASSRPKPASSFFSAILLHTLPMSAQCDYNAIDSRGLSQTSAKSLKSTSIQHQPNVTQMADAPDSKSGLRHANRRFRTGRYHPDDRRAFLSVPTEGKCLGHACEVGAPASLSRGGMAESASSRAGVSGRASLLRGWPRLPAHTVPLIRPAGIPAFAKV